MNKITIFVGKIWMYGKIFLRKISKLCKEKELIDRNKKTTSEYRFFNRHSVTAYRHIDWVK